MNECSKKRTISKRIKCRKYYDDRRLDDYQLIIVGSKKCGDLEYNIFFATNAFHDHTHFWHIIYFPLFHSSKKKVFFPFYSLVPIGIVIIHELTF